MGLRREVHDNVRLLPLENLVDRLSVRDIRLDELEVILLHERFERLEVARIGQLVDTDNFVGRMFFMLIIDEVRADEARSASNDNIHILAFLPKTPFPPQRGRQELPGPLSEGAVSAADFTHIQNSGSWQRAPRASAPSDPCRKG